MAVYPDRPDGDGEALFGETRADVDAEDPCEEPGVAGDAAGQGKAGPRARWRTPSSDEEATATNAEIPNAGGATHTDVKTKTLGRTGAAASLQEVAKDPAPVCGRLRTQASADHGAAAETQFTNGRSVAQIPNVDGATWEEVKTHLPGHAKAAESFQDTAKVPTAARGRLQTQASAGHGNAGRGAGKHTKTTRS